MTQLFVCADNEEEGNSGGLKTMVLPCHCLSLRRQSWYTIQPPSLRTRLEKLRVAGYDCVLLIWLLSISIWAHSPFNIYAIELNNGIITFVTRSDKTSLIARKF